MTVGETYGVYEILEKDETKSQEKHHVYWKCKCLKCNNIVSVRADGLKRLPKNCPNCKDNLLHQKFNRLKVIQKGKIDKNGHRYWICQCDCGNIVEINGDNLRRGLTQSCGCLRREITSELFCEDLTGKKFNKLKVLKKISSMGEKSKWLCECDCGSLIEVTSSNLKNGHTTSCGCTISKGEEKIASILTLLNIQFQKEYKFKELPNRRFDFYLPEKNICIEFDGKQHFEYVATWHKTKENFDQALLRDNEKTKFCISNNIKLIRIPYWDYDKLSPLFLQEEIENVE